MLNSTISQFEARLGPLARKMTESLPTLYAWFIGTQKPPRSGKLATLLNLNLFRSNTVISSHRVLSSLVPPRIRIIVSFEDYYLRATRPALLLKARSLSLKYMIFHLSELLPNLSVSIESSIFLNCLPQKANKVASPPDFSMTQEEWA